ncbi:MAG: PAS domain S-box protein [bacterium]
MTHALKSLKLLLIEDNADDALLIVRELGRGGYTAEWRRVDTAPALLDALREQAWDVITCDWVIPSFGAIEALEVLRDREIDAPVIIVSGEVGEEVAVTAMRGGAHDFVSKRRLARLCVAVERELRDAAARRAHRQAQVALRESEDRYRDLVEHSHDLICTHDLEGRILSVNPAPARVLGYEPSELPGMSLAALLTPGTRQQLPEYLATVLRDGIATGVMSIQTRAGARRFWEYTNTLRTEGVPVPIVRGMAHDVTDRLRAERLLKKSEEHFRALTQNALDLVAILNPDGTVRYASPSHEKTFGFTVAEMVGRQAFDFIHPDDLCGLQRRFTEGLTEVGTTVAAEYRFRRKDGTWAVVEAAAKNLADDPMVRGVLINSRDISERARAAEALRTLAAQQAGILDALPANIALLDAAGSIVTVNQAWKRFADAHLLNDPSFGVGTNYLEVCDRAQGACAEESQAAAHGIRAVLRGEMPVFSLEYPCHAPERPRWYRLMATPLVPGRTDGAVVMHIDVTERHLAKEAADT